MSGFIVEHGLEGRVEHAVANANTVQDLQKYLDKDPHPCYCLASCQLVTGDFILVWEEL